MGQNYPRETMETLTELANKLRTDKGTTFRQGHGYTPLYDLLFHPMRNLPIRLLEIGLSIGGPEMKGGSIDRNVVDVPSVRMWRHFFPNGHIYGVDISDFSRFQSEWFTFYRADCGDASQLDAVISACPEQMDIIIDDGSHASFHQQLTLSKFLPMLKPGGLYIIEDLNWQPEEYEKQLTKVIKTDRLLGSLIRSGRIPNFEGPLHASLCSVVNQIESIFIFDEDYLYSARRFYNIRSGSVPDSPNYIDSNGIGRFFKRGYMRRVLEGSKLMLQSLLGDMTPIRRPRTKLAVIRKK
jgi:hypothetical protein